MKEQDQSETDNESTFKREETTDSLGFVDQNDI